MPISRLIGSDCFSDLQIGHMRESEGYADRWYDMENDDEEMKTYIYYPQPGIDSDLYLTVSTYSHEIIPTSCTTGTLDNGNMVEYPTAYMTIYEGNKMVGLKYYLD